MTDAKRLTVVLERPVTDGAERGAQPGAALGRVVQAHPALEPLLDFVGPDPIQMAALLGVSYAHDPEDMADLTEIDFGPPEWHEATAGLAVLRVALNAVRAAPGSIAAATDDPGLRPEDVLADMEDLERSLLLALRHETRFRLTLAG